MAWVAHEGMQTAAAGSCRALYYIYDFLVNYLAGEDFDDRLVVTYSSPGAGGDWLSETGPKDDAYILLESNIAWSDATKLQILIAARETAGASAVGGVVGGVAIPSPGLFVGVARDGGWDDTDKNFGADLFSGLLHVEGHGKVNDLPACTMSLCVAERMINGVADGAMLFMWGGDNPLTGYSMSIFAGATYPIQAADTKPHAVIVGKPKAEDVQYSWGYDTAGDASARVVRQDGLAYGDACADNVEAAAGMLLTRDSGEWVTDLVRIYDLAVGGMLFIIPNCWRTDVSLADGAKNGDGTWICVNALLFPVT